MDENIFFTVFGLWIVSTLFALPVLIELNENLSLTKSKKKLLFFIILLFPIFGPLTASMIFKIKWLGINNNTKNKNIANDPSGKGVYILLLLPVVIIIFAVLDAKYHFVKKISYGHDETRAFQWQMRNPRLPGRGF